MDVREKVERWNGLLERAYLLWEDSRILRQECEAAAQLRRDQYGAAPRPPSSIDTLPAYVSILEAGIRKMMDDVKTYHVGGEGALSGEAWLQRMDERIRREGEKGGS